MAPRSGISEPHTLPGTTVEAPEDALDLTPDSSEQPEPESQRPPLQIVWRNVIAMSALHIAAVYGMYCIPNAKIATLCWGKYNDYANKNTLLMIDQCHVSFVHC